MGPLAACPGGLHGTALVRAEFTGRLDAKDAGAAKPRSTWDGGDAVARLVDADVTLVTEHHLIGLLRIRLQNKRLRT